MTLFFCLLPSAFYLQISVSLHSRLLRSAFYLPSSVLSSACPLPTAFCQLPSLSFLPAFRFLPYLFFLLSAFRLLPSLFCLHLHPAEPHEQHHAGKP